MAAWPVRSCQRLLGRLTLCLEAPTRAAPPPARAARNLPSARLPPPCALPHTPRSAPHPLPTAAPPITPSLHRTTRSAPLMRQCPTTTLGRPTRQPRCGHRPSLAHVSGHGHGQLAPHGRRACMLPGAASPQLFFYRLLVAVRAGLSCSISVPLRRPLPAATLNRGPEQLTAKRAFPTANVPFPPSRPCRSGRLHGC